MERKKEKAKKKAAEAEKELKQKRAKAKKRNKLVAGGKLGRPKKLTPAELRRGVEAYFASISYMEPVTREEFVVLNTDPKTGAVEFLLDKMGHRAVRNVPVLGVDATEEIKIPAGSTVQERLWFGETASCQYVRYLPPAQKVKRGGHKSRREKT